MATFTGQTQTQSGQDSSSQSSSSTTETNKSSSIGASQKDEISVQGAVRTTQTKLPTSTVQTTTKPTVSVAEPSEDYAFQVSFTLSLTSNPCDVIPAFS